MNGRKKVMIGQDINNWPIDLSIGPLLAIHLDAEAAKAKAKAKIALIKANRKRSAVTRAKIAAKRLGVKRAPFTEETMDKMKVSQRIRRDKEMVNK
jgi:predicted S18 family serine protease